MRLFELMHVLVKLKILRLCCYGVITLHLSTHWVNGRHFAFRYLHATTRNHYIHRIEQRPFLYDIVQKHDSCIM